MSRSLALHDGFAWSPQGEAFCPHCEHFADWHRGLPFQGGPNGEWRYRCQCGCTVDMTVDGRLRLLDRDTLEPVQ